MKPAESFIGQPIRSLQTMLRVIARYDPAIPEPIPDGIYGQETMAAVYAFQRKHGIPVTGVVNQETWEAVAEAYDASIVEAERAHPLEIILDPGEVLRKNDRNAYIYVAQGMLVFLSQLHDGISEPAISGELDSATEQALAGFQVLAGLQPTGELDKQTWRFLSHHFTLNANRSDQQAQNKNNL